MLKRSLVVVVLALWTVLAMPAIASADHPWNPPAWWSEVIAGGEMYVSQNPSYDCQVHHQSGNDVYGGHDDDWYEYCSRRYAGGYAHCDGSARHYTNNPQSAYSPATQYNTYFICRIGPRGEACVWEEKTGPYEQRNTGGWIDTQTKQPDPDCFERLKRGTSAPDRDGDGVEDGQDRCPDAAGPSNGCPAPAGDDPSGAAGHDLVSLCGRARFGWYRSNFGDPDVEKGEEACLHTVSNRVAQQLIVDGLKEMPEVFGRRLYDWAQGKLVPDPEDLIQRALPKWDQAFRTAGRLNVITRIGEAVGVAGVALGYTFAANQIANKDACVMFITSTGTNLSLDGTGSSSFEVDGWQVVYNRKNVKHPKRDAELHTASVSQKYKRRLRRDKWETRMTSMRCGKGGKVFLTKKHDEQKIVSGRVRAAG